MRKQRQRERRARSQDDDAESTEVDPSTAEGRPQAPEHAEAQALETEVSTVPGLKTEPSHDLDSLGQEIERSLTGAGSGEKAQPVRAGSNAAAPPSRNATPEDILGLQTQLYEPVEESRAADPEGPSSTPGSSTETGGSPPMEDFEERSAMAKEVLRATSDQSRRSRRAPKTEKVDEAPPDETDGADDENVRFSEDLTISAKRRRKLFGR